MIGPCPVQRRREKGRNLLECKVWTAHLHVFLTHSLSSDLERLLKVFVGSSLIRLLDRFLNSRKEESEAVKQTEETLFFGTSSYLLIFTPAGGAGRAFQLYFETADGV